MGFCMEEVGNISIELRRESFVVHAGYGYDEEGEHTPPEDHFGKHWREGGHPEFLFKDLDDLIKALQLAKRHLKDNPARKALR
jgi:hypothetical protein